MNENGIDNILQVLYSLIEDARGIPLANDKCILDREEALDLLDEAIAVLPADIKQARKIVKGCNDLLDQAKADAESTITKAQNQAAATITSANREAESIINEARAEAQEMVSKEHVYQEAQKQAQNMVNKANAQVTELKRIVNEYVSDALRQTEEDITAALRDVRETRARFQTLIREQEPTQYQLDESPFIEDAQVK